MGRFKYVALIFCLFVVPFSSMALEIPTGGQYDKRIKFIDYNPDEVVGITAHYGFSTHIEFAPGESVVKLGIGDRKAWDIGKQDNHLFLRPVGDKAGTNMTVLTNRRVYNFDLAARSSKRGAHPKPNDMFFQVKFNYPDEEARRAQAEANKTALQERLDQNDKSQPENYNYWVKGEETLAPNQAYDDRRFTYLTFANNKEMPAVYIENPDGTESLVNTHVEGDVIVLHKIASKFVLRKGKLVSCVFNRSYDPNGVTNTTGTTVPGVSRQIKEGV
jgi:type IV secretion system protein VirB9